MTMMMIIAMMMPFCNTHDGNKEGQGDETITMLKMKQKINMARKVCHGQLMSKSSAKEDPMIEFEDDEENI